MLKANVGSSVLACANSAGKEAASKAKQGMENIKVAFVYASCDYDIDAMINGIAEEMPGVPLIGNTSFTGTITPEGYITSDDGFCSIMALSDDKMSVGVASVPKGPCAVEGGKALAKAAMEAAGKDVSPEYFYMAASPVEEEIYLKGISDVIGRIPFFGGSAADNSISGAWKLYTADSSFSDGAAVAFFYDAPEMVNYYTGAYKETDTYGVITKVDGKRRLMEIDGMPACEKYMEWTGCDAETASGTNLLVRSINNPLGIKDRLGDLIAIRHPMFGNEDKSINLGSNVTEKTCVILMEGSQQDLIDSVEEAMKALLDKMPSKPAAMHLVHCGGRRAGIGDRIGEVADTFVKMAGDIPFIVEFTFGEYGFVSDNNNTCGGLMLSFTGFAAE